MLKKSEKINHRRLFRKYRNENTIAAIRSSIETVGKMFVLPPLIERIINSDRLSTYEIDELNMHADEVHLLQRYSSSWDQTPEIPFIAVFSDGYVVPQHGLIFGKQKSVVNPITHPREGASGVLIDRIARMLVRDPTLFCSTIRTNSQLWEDASHLDTAVPLFPYYINYYHWLVETLPKVRYARYYEDETEEEVDFLVPPDGPGWMIETLELLGVPDDKIVHPTERIYQVDNLIVPSWVAHSADDYNWLKETMLKRSSPEDTEGTRILISREDATDRHMTNRSDVVDLLEDYGFEKYVLSELSVEESIHLFNRADIIVGAHGAGFADIIFSEDATVIELYGSRLTSDYRNISRRLGLEYRKIECEPVYGDIRVDIDELEQNIIEVISHSP